MKIKKFNEVNSLRSDGDKNIWVFIVHDSGGFVEEDECVAFNSKFDAVDHYINWVNDSYNTEFEPMAENGNRLFTSVDENPDWEKCLNYTIDNEIPIDLIEVPII